MLIATTIRNDYCLAEKAKKNEIYLCPGCRGPVRLKHGGEKVAHFAHVSKKDCVGFSEGESADHLAGKLAIYAYFKEKVPIQIEPVLAAIDQRPDLLVGRPGNQVAIEYQCSPISKADLAKRNAGYARVGIRVWWILGPNYYRKHLSTATICRFWLAERLWYYLPGEQGFVQETGFVRADFRKRSSKKTALQDPLCLKRSELPDWAKVFEKKAVQGQELSFKVLDEQRQRTKLSLLMARKQVDEKLVSYLYEQGRRVDQMPAICLNGHAFGMMIANWQYRLTVLLLLEKAGTKGLFRSQLEARLSRCFYSGYEAAGFVLDDLLKEMKLSGMAVEKSERIFIKGGLPFKK
ncbi:competence protein [Fructobacillus sp. M1-13]|uniref:Competence protein n=1 Tax=Fructobacillus papyriferae TaxID=2713171 RepID=A0ABS5QSS8_9LACO|nr:competence protein CoiA family protein [Fructobacillus papyriferae]MBS9335369.1 competence protein [Fructobacillus papyriferae]MCD2158962.1 competence protein [Fructobacillus papyriferae]